ncbi:general transcription factor II-I repeat domain-containing protein 2A [Trichonephila clavipes]|uniref:General transcription factor II-I repeat domain-containing protein 2A n=1 Tax=Trichonephila clavipes TaxID=2585209 RepID=A0A8X6UWZ1_TRICX|nr:general transcription factor II-I repeat domain-containing protein 2A [Trichonephila clavipes]
MHSSSGANRPFKNQQWLRILQWNAGGFSHEKRTQLMSILISQDIDVFILVIRALEYTINDIITKNYKYFPNLKKNITDLDAQEKRNEEKVIDDFISIMDSLIKEFSARFSQFKELSETFKFIMYPDVISFDKLNLSQFDWLEIEELEMQLIDFQSSSIWIQKFIETRKKLELIEAERLTSNISKNTSNEILETWNSIPDAFN